ncbi:nitrate reductase cytochrome c-type subunit [Cytophagaceae bacterium ABcell3]|nr:nitrate reductase cytochrome c-type subunit [Cytophagaceae bacterium ABcell3]
MSNTSRRNIILIFALLAASFLFILNVSIVSEIEEADEAFPATDKTASIPIEEGVFRRSGFDYLNMPEDHLHNRVLEEYHQNRAYSGAPPVIPHPVVNPGISIGEKGCLQCHENGGYVQQFKAYAPVTPHPELVSCNQCHVPANTDELFRESRFKGAKAPSTGNAALEGSPPVIPHTLEMRSNCLSCHAGPAAPKEIRVSHPERSNCKQCHVPAKTPEEFKRIKDFTRKTESND